MPRPLSLARVSAMGPNPEWRMTGQRHPFNELIVVYRGSHAVHASGGVTRTKAGDVLLYPQGLSHDEISDPRDPVETVCIAFRAPMGRTLALVSDADGRLRTLARWLVDTNFLSYAGLKRLRAAYLAAIIEEFERLRLVPKEHELVRTVRAYIYSNMSRRITVDALANEANMSRFYFVRRYRELTGATPMDEVWKLRLAEARSLVAGTGLNLRTIAGMTGFANEYHFARRFKAQFRVTPGSLRGRAAGRAARR